MITEKELTLVTSLSVLSNDYEIPSV